MKSQKFKNYLLNVPVWTLLRSIMILFCILEGPIQKLDTLLLDPHQIHFSIPGLEFFSHPYLLFAFGWCAILSGGLGFFGIWSRITVIVVGGASFAFAIGATEGRVAFSYYPPLALIALGVQGYFRSSPKPVVYFVSSVYLAAALHKAVYFSEMVDWLPRIMSGLFLNELQANHSALTGAISHVMAYSVIPVELTMGTLFLFPQTRRYSFCLACIFHCSLNLLQNGAAQFQSVGFCLLLMHAIVSSQMARVRFAELVSSRLIQAAFAASFCSMILLRSELHIGTSKQTIETIGLYSILIAISVLSYFAKRNNVCESELKFREVPRSAFAIFFSGLILWSLVPKFVGHTNDHLGWAVFSSGSHKVPFHCFRFPDDRSNPCLKRIVRFPVILERRPTPEVVEYCSRQKSNLEHLRDWTTRNCEIVTPLATSYEIGFDSPRNFKGYPQ